MKKSNKNWTTCLRLNTGDSSPRGFFLNSHFFGSVPIKTTFYFVFMYISIIFLFFLFNSLFFQFFISIINFNGTIQELTPPIQPKAIKLPFLKFHLLVGFQNLTKQKNKTRVNELTSFALVLFFYFVFTILPTAIKIPKNQKSHNINVYCVLNFEN